MHECVADQVADDLAKARVVAAHHHGPGRLQGDLTLGCDRARVGCGVARNGLEVDWLGLERPALVEAGDEQHIVDQRGHPHRLLLDPSPREVGVGLRFRRAPPEHLGISTDRCEWRAQLVRGVGDEPAQPALGCGSLLEGGLDLAQHRVEGQTKPADLGPGRRWLDATAVVAGGDLSRGGAHALQGTEPDLDDHKRQQRRREDDARADDGFQDEELIQRRFDVREGDREDHDSAAQGILRPVGDAKVRDVAGA